MYKRFFVIGISILILAFCCFCLMWSKAMLAPEKPSVSIRGGMYKDELLVELSTTWENDIYYTTDGSIPTYQSLKYEEPIRITDRSQEENVYRNIRNVVKNWLEYEPDTTPVEKGTVIRAISVSKWGNSSEVMTETYFIGRDDLSDNDAYVLSLVADPEELFGENGIYVTGKEYDEWYLSGAVDSGDSPEINFWKRIEIKGNLEIFKNNELFLNQLIGIKIRGNSSREGRIKNFNLYSREEYSGSDFFDAELFENIKTHSVMIKPLSIYVMASDILADRNVSTQKSQKIKVFLNGEYWYDTYLLERYDGTYFKVYYNINDIVIVASQWDIKSKTLKPKEIYTDTMEWIKKTDFSDNEQWEMLKTKIDISSYIDYMAANIYLCNLDFCEYKNYRFWFSEKEEGTVYGDERWRWAIFDLDIVGKANGNTFSDEMPFGIPSVNENPMYQAFYANEEYREQFVLSFMDMANNNFSPENMEPILNKYGLDLSWNDNFFLERFDYITAYLAEEFGLTGTLESVELSINDIEGGSITINTSTINLSDGSWTGKYFTDYPITVTAKANEGYIFSGWEGDSNKTEETIVTSVEGGLKLKAVFERK